MKTRVYLVRHGRTGMKWDGVADPPLNEEGHRQATNLAQSLAEAEPLRLLTSPYRRARDTASPLGIQWNQPIPTEPALREIPSPSHFEAGPRDWLDQVLSARWTELSPSILSWQLALEDLLMRQSEDVVMFTHFLNIAALYSLAAKDDRVAAFSPAHCELVEFAVGSKLEYRSVALAASI